MFHVFTVFRATRPYHIGYAVTGQPFPKEARAGIMTIVHSFGDEPSAEKYMWQLREHYQVHAKQEKQMRAKIECINTQIIYESVADAARANGVSSALVSRHVNNPDQYPHARGLQYRRV